MKKFINSLMFLIFVFNINFIFSAEEEKQDYFSGLPFIEELKLKQKNRIFDKVFPNIPEVKRKNILTQLRNRQYGSQREISLSENLILYKLNIIEADDKHGRICNVQFSHDGKYLAVAIESAKGNLIKIYNSITGGYLKTLNNKYKIKDINWSHDNEYLLAVSYENICIWNISIEESNDIEWQQASVYYADFIHGSSNKIFVFDNSIFTKFRIYNLIDGSYIENEYDKYIRKVRCSPDGTKIILADDCSENQFLEIFDLKTQQFEKIDLKHCKTDYFFSYDNKYLFVFQENIPIWEADVETKATIIDLSSWQIILDNIDFDLDFKKCRGCYTHFVSPYIALLQSRNKLLFFDFELNKEVYYKELNAQICNNLSRVKSYKNLMALQFQRGLTVCMINDIDNISNLI